eukprot:Em0013g219a
MFAYLFLVIVWLSSVVSTPPPEPVSGLKSCYNAGEDVSIVISQTQSNTQYMMLACREFGNNSIMYSNYPDKAQNVPLTPGPPYYYTVTLLSLGSPIQAQVSAIFKSELDGSTITRRETESLDEPWVITGRVSLKLCGWKLSAGPAVSISVQNQYADELKKRKQQAIARVQQYMKQAIARVQQYMKQAIARVQQYMKQAIARVQQYMKQAIARVQQYMKQAIVRVQQYMKQAIARVQQYMKQAIARVQQYMKQAIARVQQYMKQAIARVQQYMKQAIARVQQYMKLQ